MMAEEKSDKTCPGSGSEDDAVADSENGLAVVVLLAGTEVVLKGSADRVGEWLFVARSVEKFT